MMEMEYLAQENVFLLGLFHFWNNAALLLFLIRFFIIKKPKKAVNIA